MLLLVDVLNDAPRECNFAEQSGKPLGGKVKLFKMCVGIGGVLEYQKPRMQKLYACVRTGQSDSHQLKIAL